MLALPEIVCYRDFRPWDKCAQRKQINRPANCFAEQCATTAPETKHLGRFHFYAPALKRAYNRHELAEAASSVPGQLHTGAMKTETEDKVWGRVRHVFASPHAAVSILQTVRGGYCSRHFHKERINRFIVETGCIEVVEYNPTGELEANRTKLGPGEVWDVDAEVIHRFEVIEPGLVIEVYYPARPGAIVSHHDIERLDIGGRTLRAA